MKFMYKKMKIAAILPCYNEEKLISKTINTMNPIVDVIIPVDDASTDTTASILRSEKISNPLVHPVFLSINEGIGGAYIHGFDKALELNADLVITMAGDAQCNPDYIPKMIETLLESKADYVKANRFVHLNELKQMPKFRRIGNTIITILTKFSSGYYSIFDSQNGYGVFKRATIESLPIETIGKRYDYENTLLIALSIMGAKVKDVPVPAIYGEETSTIPVFKTTIRALRVVRKGFWKRIYYKYILYGLHPIALFLFSGLLLSLIGFAWAIYITVDRIFFGVTPTTGSVMLVALPLILGFQMLLTAITMDVNNENKPI